MAIRVSNDPGDPRGTGPRIAPLGVQLTNYEVTVPPNSFNYILFYVRNSSCGGWVRLLF